MCVCVKQSKLLLILLHGTFLQGTCTNVQVMHHGELLKETIRNGVIKEVLQLVTPVGNDGGGTATHPVQGRLSKHIRRRTESRGFANLAKLGRNEVGSMTLRYIESQSIPRQQCSCSLIQSQESERRDQRNPWKPSRYRREDRHRP